MKQGKRYTAALNQIDKSKLYEVEEGLALAIETAKAKFDETVELHIRLGVDGRNADQQVRGVVVLPHGTGKSVKVLVIARGDKADEAAKAGADYVGAEEIISKLTDEMLKFAASMEFEKAAEIRDKIKELEKLL